MPSGLRRSRVSRAAISLLEVLVVLTIIGVASGVVAPAFRRSMTETVLESSARQVRELVERARRTSIRQGVPVTLTIDTGAARFWVVATGIRADSLIASGSLAMPAGLRLESAARRAAFRFAATGEVTSADHIVIRDPTTAISISSIGWRVSMADHDN